MGYEKKSFDEKTMLENFAGIEDLARDAALSFLDSIPVMLEAINKAIISKDAKKIEISAHTLKGSVSNFYAETCRELSYKLEKLGHQKTFNESELNSTFEILKSELKLLEIDLIEFTKKRKSA